MTIQERWDATFEKLDRSAPAQRADEASVDYLRRLSRIGRKYIPRSEQLASVNFAELPDETVPKFSELMRQCVEKNLRRTDNMAPGEIRAVMQVDPNTGQKIREFIGPQSFVRNPLYGHAIAEKSPGSARQPAARCGKRRPRPVAMRLVAGNSFALVRLGGRRVVHFLGGRPLGGCDRLCSIGAFASAGFFEGFDMQVNVIFVPVPVLMPMRGNGVAAC
ncbi:MAG TPA: hypothetical protein VFE60_06995 [Roseiarcus sp.]|jgi:hypothetical protein|nr:hypothetical protein [Roseiarcus sp.]